MATVTTTPFELEGADGGPLRGDVRTADGGRDRPAVIVCHGFKGFKNFSFFPHVAERLARSGMTAVTFNFSGSGVGPDGENFSELDRFGHSTFSNDLRDLDHVVTVVRDGVLCDWLVPPPSIGVMGHSRGGGTAILHSARDRELGALVTWAAIGTVHRWADDVLNAWRHDGSIDIVNTRTGQVLPLHTDTLDDLRDNAERLDIEAAAARITCPWLIVHGDQDESVSVGDAHRLHGCAGAVSRVALVAGGGHTFGGKHPWAGSTAQLDRAVDLTVEWFVSHLL